MAITERRLALKEEERHYVGVKPKVKRREENRERKALAAAKIEKAIEKELLERLKSGAYGDKPLNVDENIWKKVLGKVDEAEDEEEEFDDEDEVDLISDDESDVGEVEYVEDDGEDELVDLEDLEQWLGDSSEDSESDSSDDEVSGGKRKAPESNEKRKRRPRVEIEYEQEQEREPLTNIATS